RVALGTEEGNGHRQVVDDVQHGDGDDEGKIEPVRDVDVGFLALQDRAEEDEEIGYPDDGQPNVDVPFGFRIFTALGDAEQVACGRHNDEKLVAPEDEPGEIAAKEAGAAGALDHVEGGGDKRVAAEGEDDRRCVQRTDPAEGEPGLKGKLRERKLDGNDDTDEQAHDRPEDGGDRTIADGTIQIALIFIRTQRDGGRAIGGSPGYIAHQ